MQRFNLRSRSTSQSQAGSQENRLLAKQQPNEAPAKTTRPATRSALGEVNGEQTKLGGKAADVKKTGYGAHGQSRLARPPLRTNNSVSSTALGGKTLRSSKAALPPPAPEAKPVKQEPLPEVKAEAVEDVEMGTPKKEPSVSPKAATPMEAEISEDAGGASSYSSQMIPDIDDGDEADPQMAARFAPDVFLYLRHYEQKLAVHDNFLHKKVVTPRMRGILVDWLHQVATRFSLLPETMYLTVNVVDRYLQMSNVGKEKLQLVGVTGMLIASKYEEMYSPEINDFVYITDDSYTAKEILAMEVKMLAGLGCQLGRPLPIHFLRRFSKAAMADGTLHTLAKYLLELSSIEYSLASVLPSHLAGAGFLLATWLLQGTSETADDTEKELAGLWTPTLRHYSSVSFSAIHPVLRKIAKLLIKVNGEKTKLQAVRAKFSSPKLGAVAKNSRLSEPRLSLAAGL